MKRALSMLLALVLLLTCFSGMVVSATEMDEAEVVVVPEVTEETEETETPEPTPEPEATEELAPEATEEPATEVPAQETEADAEIEVPMEYVDLFPNTATDDSEPATYAAAQEHELSASFMNYLLQQFAKCPSKFSIEKYNIPSSQWENLKSVIWYETPELFHVKGLGCSTKSGKITTVSVSYRTHADTASEYKTCLNKMTTNAEYLLRGVKGNSALSAVEKALILHDRLAIWTEYDLQNVNTASVDHKIFAAYSALGEGLSVCQGYSMAYMYLLEQVGIESDLCSSDKLWHSWNIVYIDGVPYYTDVTWDDSTNNWPNNSPFFDDIGHVRHVNFMRSYNGIWSTGHNKTDYPVVNAGTKYDSGWWWMDSNSSIELIGDKMYYVDNTDGAIYEKTKSGTTELYQHNNPNNGPWVRLASAGAKLVIGDVWDIKTLDLLTGTVATLLDADDYRSGSYVEGLKYQNGKLQIQLNQNNWSYRYNTALNTSIVITKQPEDIMVGSGKTAKTTVEAVGDGLTYTWYFKNADAMVYSLSSVTTNTYSTAMAPVKDGRTVYCVITDRHGNSVTSEVATLYYGNRLNVTAQPQNASAPLNKIVKTTLKATGDGLTYTWYFKNATATEWSVSSSTAATYSATMYPATDGRQVYCVVTDKYGNSFTSDVVTLYAGNTLKITTQPKNVTVGVGQTVKIPLKATGDGLTYTWYFKDTTKSDYSVSSVTTNTYTTTMKANAAGRKVYCVVTDKYGASVQSSVVTITKGNLVKITTQPTNTAVASGKTAKVTIKASGDGLTYTWYYAKKGSKTYTKASTTGTTYSVKMSSSVNGRTVYCVVKDKYGNSVKSNVVTLHKGTPVKIKTQPVSTKAPSGMKATVTVKASGSGLKYAWYFKNAGASTYSKSSLTGSSYYVTMKDSVKNRQVYCVITDKYGVSVKSNVVTLGLAPTLKITKQPATVVTTNGSTAKVSVTASGDGVTYTWYYAKSGSSSYKKLSTKTASYSVKMSSSIHGRKVYCVVKDKYGASVKSSVVTLYDSSKLLAGTWKESSRQVEPGYVLYLNKMTLTVSSNNVTLKAKDSRTGTNMTYKYTLKYVKLSGNTVYYKFTNSVETLEVTYSITSKQLAMDIGGITTVYFKK